MDSGHRGGDDLREANHTNAAMRSQIDALEQAAAERQTAAEEAGGEVTALQRELAAVRASAAADRQRSKEENEALQQRFEEQQAEVSALEARHAEAEQAAQQEEAR